jgi:hypothetical protein
MSFSVPGYAFDDYLCVPVTHVLIEQIFRAVEVAPPSPTGLCSVQGVG